MPATQQQSRANQPGTRSSSTATPKKSWSPSSLPTVAIPPSLKRIFDRFPIITYPENSLPLSSPQTHFPDFDQQNTLYVWTSAADAAAGKPSFHPTCLQTQTYLHFLHAPFTLCSANNHAAPTGSLPHLIPQRRSNSIPATPPPIRAAALPAWARGTTTLAPAQRQIAAQTDAEAIDPIHDILATTIRPAYIAALYLHEHTFRAVVVPRYVDSASRSALVRFELALQLRRAAYSELAAAGDGLAQPGAQAITTAAAAGLEMLAARLGTREWFSLRRGSASGHADDDGGEDVESMPGMLDAAVFAYTHTIVSLFEGQHETSPAWALREEVLRHGNLVRHRARILEQYYA